MCNFFVNCYYTFCRFFATKIKYFGFLNIYCIWYWIFLLDIFWLFRILFTQLHLGIIWGWETSTYALLCWNYLYNKLKANLLLLYWLSDRTLSWSNEYKFLLYWQCWSTHTLVYCKTTFCLFFHNWVIIIFICIVEELRWYMVWGSMRLESSKFITKKPYSQQIPEEVFWSFSECTNKSL